jgi:hypothetical protein
MIQTNILPWVTMMLQTNPQHSVHQQLIQVLLQQHSHPPRSTSQQQAFIKVYNPRAIPQDIHHMNLLVQGVLLSQSPNNHKICYTILFCTEFCNMHGCYTGKPPIQCNIVLGLPGNEQLANTYLPMWFIIDVLVRDLITRGTLTMCSVWSTAIDRLPVRGRVKFWV